MATQMEDGYTVYAKHTAVNGDVSYQEHRAWDKERFISIRTAEALNENLKQEPGKPRKGMFEQITEQQYRDGKRPKRT